MFLNSMEVILDSSFIISCLRKRIDFLQQLEEQGFKAVIPREVMQEMKDLSKSKRASNEDKIAINAALELIEIRNVKKVGFGKGKVDDYLIERGKKGIYIATLDNGIKRVIPNKIVIFNAKGKVGVG
jgi:rRNA-processing protein FCF1